MKSQPNEPRILIYDIETSYIITKEKRWGLWDDRPIEREIIQDWHILCFAYKWLGEKKVTVVAQPDFPMDYRRSKTDDRKVVEHLIDLFSKADVVVAHNGNSFDQKKVQARAMVHHLPPPMPYAQIDTKLEMKKVAAHTSNRLVDLNRSLSLEHKLEAGGIKTWDGCMAGDKKAWRQMKKYNKGDIVALEELYLLERPWMKNHPALNVLSERPQACKVCLSENIKPGMKYASTKSNLYQYFRCGDCGHPMKARLPKVKQASERMAYA